MKNKVVSGREKIEVTPEKTMVMNHVLRNGVMSVELISVITGISRDKVLDLLKEMENEGAIVLEARPSLLSPINAMAYFKKD